MTESLNSNEVKKKKNSKLKILLFLFIILIMITVSAIYYYNDQIKPVSTNNGQDIEIEITKGSSTASIARLLEEKNIIRNQYIFRYITMKSEKDGKLKAGKYVLNTAMSPENIIEKLVEGGITDNTKTFTIPEGFEVGQIAQSLSQKGFVDEEEFVQLASDIKLFSDEYSFISELSEGATLEGYLYPDTYEIFDNAKEEDIIRKMLDKFQDIYEKEIKDKLRKTGFTLNEAITLASIIEREGRVDSERSLISAVFHNRLKRNMLLESCATVQFALGERKEVLTYKDLKIESLYNTYIHNGLPPGPIASPGVQSIIAAVEPANVDYLFFVSNGDGTHTFTNNYKDHLNAKNRN